MNGYWQAYERYLGRRPAHEPAGPSSIPRVKCKVERIEQQAGRWPPGSGSGSLPHCTRARCGNATTSREAGGTTMHHARPIEALLLYDNDQC